MVKIAVPPFTAMLNVLSDVGLTLRGEGLFLSLGWGRVVRAKGIAFHRPVRGRKSLHVEIKQDPFLGPSP